MVRLVALALIAALTTPANGAEIAVDLQTGSVLAENDADALRYPASLAKLMTAFVAFDAMDSGEVASGSMVRISRTSAAQPPVKLGLRAGRDLAFDSLLGAAIVGSRNDAAVAVAEAVAGSEAGFVARMNAAAARLGMVNTRFANASGLPREGQKTTARDIALLSRALLERFPVRSALFSRRSVQAMGKRVATTNPLFGRVTGAAGLKTGFTCAAGYSIAALVEREGRRVLVVTLGDRDKAARLRRVTALIDSSLTASPQATLRAASAPSGGAPPDIAACAGAPAAIAVATSDISPKERALYAMEVARLRAAVPRKPAPVPRAEPVARPLSGWAAFFGGFATKAEADRRLATALAGKGRMGIPHTEIRRRDGHSLALIHGLDRSEATVLCRSTSAYCIIVGPRVLLNPKAQWRR